VYPPERVSDQARKRNFNGAGRGEGKAKRDRTVRGPGEGRSCDAGGDWVDVDHTGGAGLLFSNDEVSAIGR